MKRKSLILLIICIMTYVLAGCGGKTEEANLADKIKKAEESVAENNDSPKKKESMKKKTANKEKKLSSVPVYCISSPGDVECETIHVIDVDGSYAKLSERLEALNDDFVAAAYDTGIEDTVHNICVRRSDDRVFSFVHEYREPDGEADYVEMRGHSFLIDTGKELKLSDIVDDEDAFYKMLSDELYKNVTEVMMIMVGEFDISVDDFDASSAINECLNDNRYGWVLDPQGVTFWFENVNALIGHASATVLFSADKTGTVFNEEFVKNAPNEWIMRIPESYSSETYFDCDDDGIIDSIYWYPDGDYLDGEYLESGFGAKYNSRYFDSSEICPADEMPWSHYRVYLMHKDNQTVLVKHHYEEAESIWDSFSLTNDIVKSIDRVFAYPEYENYAQQASGWLVPTDMSAIRVYSDHGGDEMTEYPDEILAVSTDGRMKVSELPDKDSKSSGESSSGSMKQAGLSKVKATEIADTLGGNVCVLEVHDYDGDGADEAFAVLGGEDEFGGYLPDEIWFISSDGKAQTVRDDFKGLSLYTENDHFYMEYADENKVFFYGDCGGYGSGWTTFIFGVNDGEPYELDISMDAEGFYQDTPGNFYTLTDNFDSGHDYLITPLIYNSKTGQFTKDKPTGESWLE